MLAAPRSAPASFSLPLLPSPPPPPAPPSSPSPRMAAAGWSVETVRGGLGSGRDAAGPSLTLPLPRPRRMKDVCPASLPSKKQKAIEGRRGREVAADPAARCRHRRDVSGAAPQRRSHARRQSPPPPVLATRAGATPWSVGPWMSSRTAARKGKGRATDQAEGHDRETRRGASPCEALPKKSRVGRVVAAIFTCGTMGKHTEK